MKRTKEQKGITLIALIITIVVLLILAAVAISSIQENGILGYATNAADSWNKAQENETAMLQNYLEYLENQGNGAAKTLTVATAKNKVLSTTANTDVYDEYGNKIVVPAGFKIVVDPSTNNADTVTEGIVIEDATYTGTIGSQFVWIPVGKVYTDTAKTDSLAKTITLGRYAEFTATSEPMQTIENCMEAVKIGDSEYYGYFEAYNISWCESNPSTFLNSAKTNSGYYIARYEAGDATATAANEERTENTGVTNTMVCKANQIKYNYVTDSEVLSLCNAMYDDVSESITSTLINSFAWDTALIFFNYFSDATSNVDGYYTGQWELTTETYSGSIPLEISIRQGESRNSYDEVNYYRRPNSEWRPILYITL